jgi:hypothetical protein
MISTIRNAHATLGLAAALLLAACAPLPQQGADANAPQSASAPSAASAVQAAMGNQGATQPAKPALGPGEQRIVVGTENGYHRIVKATAPSQVCDYGAFADGVRYGYAQTWNRLVGEEARDAGGKTSKRKFDAAALRSQDEQYAIQWNGKERVNACASDGYLIGRVVGTHIAGIDMKPAS